MKEEGHQAGTVRRYVVGTEDGQFYVDPYGGDMPWVFTSEENAHELASSMTGGFMPGPDRTLIKVSPWKVYELVEMSSEQVRVQRPRGGSARPDLRADPHRSFRQRRRSTR